MRVGAVFTAPTFYCVKASFYKLCFKTTYFFSIYILICHIKLLI
jgi:hypothetical protein